MNKYTEDQLVQKTTADFLEQELGWQSVYAYNSEKLGSNGTLGRESERDVVLTQILRRKLEELNPDLPEEAYQNAIRQVTEVPATQNILATNEEKHDLIRDGIQVRYHDEEGNRRKQRLNVFDFRNPDNNEFLAVRELWVQGPIYRRRPDLIGFVNGLPLIFMELKNIHRNLRNAYEENLADYRDTIPHLLHHNAVIILGNGDEAQIGTITSEFEHFANWKRLSEEQEGVVDMETLLRGVCSKDNFIDIFENFIVFDHSSRHVAKILARNHQFLGVNRAVESVKERKERNGKLGVFWHTQGAGKSYSMVFFSRKVRRKLGGNFTFLICTDREDLDSQIYNTFAGCGLADNDRDPCRAKDAEHLQELLGEHKAYLFSLIQKFHEKVDPKNPYNARDDIIVISDEAHRTQYGQLAINMRNALPNASYIGFTGTPLFKSDEITKRVFGDYVSTYDFQRAVDDGATVPLYYDPRGEKLDVTTNDLNERVAEKLDELSNQIEDVDMEQRLQKELGRDYHVITAEKRLRQIARDFVDHYSSAWQRGKAMFVCIDKITCVRMYNYISEYWDEKIAELEAELKSITDEQELMYCKRRIEWMRETQKAVVISEEQGEVEKFRNWDLDIEPHRQRLKEGFGVPEELRDKSEFQGIQQLDPASAFKEEAHPFRIAIVCAMWMTGFDVPSLSHLYLDKQLKAHTLMQAIARANRVDEGKNNGLIVDYCGIVRNLRKALSTYAIQGDTSRSGTSSVDPTKPAEELLDELKEAIGMVEQFLENNNASLQDVMSLEGFNRNAAIVAAKEAANQNDESRKRFEVMCREVFKKYKACINVEGREAYQDQYEAINAVYRSLQKDRENADISNIIRELHDVVEEAIDTRESSDEEEQGPINIAEIDFDRLKKEFEQVPQKNTTVQELKQVVEQRLHHLLQKNPTRTDLQQKFEEIVTDYNQAKDRIVVEQTFEELLDFTQSLTEEEERHVREGLDEETLAIFDLLKKPDLSPQQIEQLKGVAADLLEQVKDRLQEMDDWQEKEQTRDAIRTTIKDFLWSEETGLPVAVYGDQEVAERSEEVYHHVLHKYPTVPSPYYPVPSEN